MISSLTAKHVDSKLRAGNKEATDEELESQGHLLAVRCLDSGPSDLKPASLPGTHA